VEDGEKEQGGRVRRVICDFVLSSCGFFFFYGVYSITRLNSRASLRVTADGLTRGRGNCSFKSIIEVTTFLQSVHKCLKESHVFKNWSVVPTESSKLTHIVLSRGLG
jgi:hypothetical protein